MNPNSSKSSSNKIFPFKPSSLSISGKAFSSENICKGTIQTQLSTTDPDNYYDVKETLIQQKSEELIHLQKKQNVAEEENKFPHQVFTQKNFPESVKDTQITNDDNIQIQYNKPFSYSHYVDKIITKLAQEKPSKYGSNLLKKVQKTHKKRGMLLSKNIQLWKNTVGIIILMNKGVRAFSKVNNDIQKYGITKTSTFARQSSDEFILLPYCKFKIFWNILQLTLLLYTALFVPFKLAFLDYNSLSILILDYIVDCLFALDIIVNFFSAYVDRKTDKIITNKRMIAINYLKSWFIFDIFVCFPFQVIFESQEGQYNGLLRLLRLPRFYRVFRIVKLINMAKNIQRQSPLVEKFLFEIIVNAGVLRFIQILFTLILFVHIFGCLWFQIAGYCEYNPRTWVARYELLDSSIGEQYVASIYWVLQTLTTVGYGDMSANTIEEKIFSLFLMIIGVGLYSFMIGSLTSILSNIDGQEQQLITKFMCLNKYASMCKLPRELVLRMKHTLEKNHSESKVEESHLLKEFPLPMQIISLLNQNRAHAKTFNKIGFFKNKDPRFILEIISSLKPTSLDPNELVYCEGDSADDVYFIEEGRVDLFTDDGYVFKTLVEGSFFGDIEILQHKRTREFNVIVNNNFQCKLLILRRHDFFRILANFPKYRKEFETLAFTKQMKNAEALKLAQRSENKLDQKNYEIFVKRSLSNQCLINTKQYSDHHFNIHNSFSTIQEKESDKEDNHPNKLNPYNFSASQPSAFFKQEFRQKKANTLMESTHHFENEDNHFYKKKQEWYGLPKNCKSNQKESTFMSPIDYENEYF